jgi:hypothetical protein
MKRFYTAALTTVFALALILPTFADVAGVAGLGFGTTLVVVPVLVIAVIVIAGTILVKGISKMRNNKKDK